ncbi:MAG TPA: hypothetical protein VFR74_03340 [Jiangellales bacterium]|nr:hypothetical protein [Jiangellales bacterium]
MLITNHVLSGALVGLAVPGPASAAAGGFCSHFLLDAVPHFGVDEEHLMRIAVPDGLLGLACIGAVLATTAGPQRLRVAAGVAGACLPDMDKPGRQFFDRSPFPAWFDRFHDRIQREAVHRWTVELSAAAAVTTTFALLVRRQR